MAGILVADYSLTGTTRRAAERLCVPCHARAIHIADARERRGILGILRSAWEALRARCPEIRTAPHAPQDFDIVVLATPVWAGQMASPMRSYVTAHRHGFRNVAFLCTQKSSGAEQVFDTLTELCGKAPVATLALGARDIESGADGPKIDAFAARLVSLTPED